MDKGKQKKNHFAVILRTIQYKEGIEYKFSQNALDLCNKPSQNYYKERLIFWPLDL